MKDTGGLAVWKCALPLAVVLAVLSATASAHMKCDDRDSGIRAIENMYGQKQVAVGLVTGIGESGWVTDKALAEILATRNGSSLRILITKTNGITCLFATGIGLSAGDLGPTQKYFFPDGGYTNLVAVGKFTSVVSVGQLTSENVFIVVTTEHDDWLLLPVGPLGIGTPLLSGENWETNTIPPDPRF